MIIQFLCCLFLCHFSLANDQIFIERMEHGQYMIAVPVHLTKDRRDLHARLSKYIHLPQYKQQDHKKESHKIEYDFYPQNLQQLDISKSVDKQALLKLKDFCIGKTDKKGLQDIKGLLGQLTPSQKLQRFKKGKCSPVVIVPGILATSLIIEIDCQILREKNPQIASSCGWTGCGPVSGPQKQYLLWVGLDLFLKLEFNHQRCFGNLFGLIYKNDNSTNYGARYSFPEGTKSTWFGNTESSKKYSQCGANAIRDLSGHVSKLSVMGSTCFLGDYARLIDILTAMGYESGITMQPLPYDFRYGILAGQTQKLIPQVINNLYKMTGKKVVVVAHSLGTLHTLSALAFFVNKKMKDTMVRHYIPIAPPWFGTIMAIKNVLFSDVNYFDGKRGINKYAQQKFTRIAGGTYELFLKFAFDTQRDQPWMKEVLKRIQYENTPVQRHNLKDDIHERQDIPLSWFPSKTQKCFDDFFKKDPSCQMGLIDFKTTPIFQIKNKKYYGTEASITQLLKDNLSDQQFKAAMSIWEQTKQKNKSLQQLPAPGVNTSMIFTTLYNSDEFYKYDVFQNEQRSLKLKQTQFVKPNVTIFGPGDVSVPSWSPLLFISKWIHNKANGNNTINVIQYCGNYKGNNNKVYSTLACQCNKNPFKNQQACTHPCMISDRYLISFVLGILTNSKKGYADDQLTIGQAMSFSDMQLRERAYDCINLKPGNYLGNCGTDNHQSMSSSLLNDIEDGKEMQQL